MACLPYRQHQRGRRRKLCFQFRPCRWSIENRLDLVWLQNAIQGNLSAAAWERNRMLKRKLSRARAFSAVPILAMEFRRAAGGECRCPREGRMNDVAVVTCAVPVAALAGVSGVAAVALQRRSC